MLVTDVMQAEVELFGELRVVALNLRHHGLGEAILVDALGQAILCVLQTLLPHLGILTYRHILKPRCLIDWDVFRCLWTVGHGEVAITV